MIDLIPYLKNIHGSPKTTILGAILILFSGYLIYENRDNLDTIQFVINGGLISAGITLFLLEDYQAPKKDEA